MNGLENKMSAVLDGLGVTSGQWKLPVRIGHDYITMQKAEMIVPSQEWQRPAKHIKKSDCEYSCFMLVSKEKICQALLMHVH